MADETHVIRGINWREAFPFTQIFRSFRIAIHPTKIVLALAAILCIYGGGRVLDMIWPVQGRAIPGELGLFERYHRAEATPTESFKTLRDLQRTQIETRYVRLLRDDLKIETDENNAKNAARTGALLGKVKDKYLEQRNKAIDDAAKVRDDKLKDAKDEAAKKQIRIDYRAAVNNAIATANNSYEQAAQIKGEGVFIQFFRYEIAQVNNVVWAVMGNDWLGDIAGNPPARRGEGNAVRPGVLAAVRNFFVIGPWWMVSQHTTYCVLFWVLFSIVWAVLGGAIARIAAVHVARDEKISLGSAVRFSTGKFLSFIFAPLIPLLIVLLVGLIVALGGLVGNIPFIGPILMGLLFFLALAAGFVMTLVLLGTGGGFNLMYPTIAVEGSDSFDAISRSFSYVYARPWRMLFYTVVALLYGALCYFFVRFFLWLLLVLTHYFVGWGMMSSVDGSRIPLDLWSFMWPKPDSRDLTYELDSLTLGGGSLIGAGLIAMWVYLTIAVVGAFAVSFYFSANTVIYYLMRREVDATELDDVYLEQTEEEFAETAPAAATEAAPAVTPVTPAPAATDTAAVITPPPPDQPSPPANP